MGKLGGIGGMRLLLSLRAATIAVVGLGALIAAGLAAQPTPLPLPLSVDNGRQEAVNGAAPGKANVHAVAVDPHNKPKPTVATHPNVLHLQAAQSKVFDVRTLHGTVVKIERQEDDVPGLVDPDAPSGGGDADTSAVDPDQQLPTETNADQGTQTAVGAPAPAADSSFEGLDFATWGNGHPPDTNGDVGPTYYIQAINTSIGIYDKSTGNRVAAFTFNALMSQGHFGNLCDTNNFGDPVVLYDTFEDRWFITDFAFSLDGSGNISPQTVYQCFAVSKTGDPVNGGWNFYSVLDPGGLGDYPKFGIWPDGIYMSANMFGYASGAPFMSPHVWAINKAQMYAGAPSVSVVDFSAPSVDFTLLPANARLQTGTPPTGTPEYFVATEEFLNGQTVYKMQVDWDKISTSTFSGPDVPVASTCWPNATPANASTTGNAADVLPIRAMAQAQYTNIGGAESLWVDHTVDRGEIATANCGATTPGNAATRWYQINVTGRTVAANDVQSRTYDPDGANTSFRYVPALAVDRAGNMAIGYTKSNSTTAPQIQYAGRLAGDPINMLSQGEQTLINGTGSQAGNCGSSACIRWGDYSGMALDPNGCEFWMTGEYYATTGNPNLNFNTRIGSFHFPGCTTVGNGTLSGTVTDGTNPVPGVTVSLGSRTTTTDGSGNYSFTIPAGTYPMETAALAGFDPAVPALNLVVPNGGTLTKNFTLGAAAQSGCFTDNSQSTFQRGVPNGCDLTANPDNVQLKKNITINQTNTSVTNTGFLFNSTSWAGQTFTPSVTGQVTQVDLNLFCSSCTGTTPNITVSIRATATVSGHMVPAGADLATATIPGFSGSGGYFSAAFSSPPTLTAGTRYAFVFRAVSNPTAGTYAYTCSCTDGVNPNSNPYANGQRVTSSNSGTSWTADTTVGGRDLGFNVWMNQGFPSSGTFTSSLKDANPAPGRSPMWTTLTFNDATPAGTSVKFQVAGSNSASGPFNFVGPDGTAGTFFTTTGTSLTPQFDGYRYLKYQATLTTSNSAVTPSISFVQICFSDVGSSAATSLAVSPVSGTYGGTVNLSATLTSNGDPVSAESVAFSLNGTSVGSAPTNASGVATLNGVSVAGIIPGSYPTGVGATFAGDSNYTTASGTAALTVDQADTNVSVLSDTNPSVFGQTVTFTATVTAAPPGSGTPTGTVLIGTGPFTSLSAAAAAGDTNIKAASVSGYVAGMHLQIDEDVNAEIATIQTVGTAGSTGTGITLTAPLMLAHTSGSDVTGLTSATLVSGSSSASTSTLAARVAAYDVSAWYLGDSNFAGNRGATTQTVNKADTSTAVGSSVNPSVAGQQVTYTATVSAVAPGSGTPAGAVTFKDGVTTISCEAGSSTILSSGQQTCKVTYSSSAGSPHSITAAYGGSSSYNTSTSVSLSQAVGLITTTTSISTNANPSLFSQGIQLSATVSSSGGTPDGNVQFSIDGVNFGAPVALDGSGHAVSGTTTTLSVGSHSVSASYAGSSSFASSSASSTQTVNKANAIVTVTSNVNPSKRGTSVTFTVTVAAQSPATKVPSGKVKLLKNGVRVGTVHKLSGGTSTWKITFSTAATYSMTAGYLGNINFNALASPVFQQVVTT
jgi:Bacterial Ig-like domain (group 3)